MTARDTVTAFSRVCGHISRGVDVALVTLIALLVVTVWIQVFGRLVLNHSPLWTVDYATLFLVWATFLGAAAALRRNEHFTIDVVIGEHHRWRRVSEMVSHVVVLAILGFLVVAGAGYVASNAGRLSGMTEVAMTYYVAAVPVGCALMLLFTLEHIAKALVGVPGGVDAADAEGASTDA